ncbi:hypothetical protein AXF42_Ash003926 [Apostasia shenzhenica]|uniref:Uncharacterized protein n=1 Tax=Apostasia shenzhenica TaxID=1088818 RepID=A0A2I0AIA4_9ASPA|nr:hypothetical protein AXF42_Ash003926 [Apostasia shenzhenica]
MSSNYAAGGEDSKYHHGHHQAPSPRSLGRSWSSSSSACGQGTAGSTAPKCVCAPATHAGSFKCRLHRVNSHGHSAPTASLPQRPPVTASSTRTVEAS